MDKDDKPTGGPPGAGLIMLALVTAGAIFVATKPLESSRPNQPEQRLERTLADQDTDARLWQDPFAAVAKARERAARSPAAAATEAQAHGEARFQDALLRQARSGGKDAGAVVLAVLLSGGPYAERTESRLRTRHAVLAGLNARGLVPVDSEHIGYFHPADNTDGLWPETVPFESFVPTPEAQARAATQRSAGRRVVVLWLDSANFYVDPLARLSALAERTSRKATTAGLPVRWRVLGPSSSDGLRSIIEEVDQQDFKTTRQLPLDLRLVSAAATVSDAALLRGTQASPAAGDDKSVHKFLLDRGVPLLRATGTDDRLARALITELGHRGLDTAPRRAPPQPADPGSAKPQPVDPCDLRLNLPPAQRPSHVAIVSEWDTLYGRTLRQHFRYDPQATEHRTGLCISRWYYVRGLDGRLPGDAAPATADNRGKKDGSNDPLSGQGTYIERPEGHNQFDYLRRMAARMRVEDAALRRTHGPEGGIRAIGVLGNDVYDKLLVLQALQSEMPHAIYFTTDLDARMFHPAEQTWARNLIVASNFGLRLHDELQRELAPFRDSYQTAAYLGTLVAMADAARSIDGIDESRGVTQTMLDGWFQVPRVFEIARSGAFDYSPTAVHAGPDCRRWRVAACAQVHPPGEPLVPQVTGSAVFLTAAVLMLAVWAPALALSRNGRRQVRRFVVAGGPGQVQRRLRAGLLVVAGVGLAVAPPLVFMQLWPALAATLTAGGKPMTLFDGISPWPTYAIRMATLLLCLYMVWRAWSALAANVHDIARDMRLGSTRRQLQQALALEEQHLGRLQRTGAMLSLRFYRERPGLFAERTGMTLAATSFWKHFVVQNRASARLVRTVLCVLLMSGLALLITNAMGDAPSSPLRGDWSRRLQWLSTWPTGLAVQFLIFFVADATLLCVFFLRGLRLHDANWPLRTLQAFERETGVPAQYLDDWIDLQFIVRRTRVIGQLIYYPFIVLSLMLLARSSFFDDWNSPPSVYIVATLCYAIVLGCVLALRRSAEASRKQTVERLRNAVLRARGDKDLAGLAAQLDLLRERAERLSEGALAPFSRQPLLRAVLLPLLTFGGSSLFDYLTLLNL